MLDVILNSEFTNLVNLIQIIFFSLVFYIIFTGERTDTTLYFVGLTSTIFLFSIGRFLMVNYETPWVVILGFKTSIAMIIFLVPVWALFVLAVFEKIHLTPTVIISLLTPSFALSFIFIFLNDSNHIDFTSIQLSSIFNVTSTQSSTFFIYLVILIIFVLVLIFKSVFSENRESNYYTGVNIISGISFIAFIILDSTAQLSVPFDALSFFTIIMYLAYMLRLMNDLNFIKPYKIENTVIQNLEQPFLLLNDKQEVINCNFSAKSTFAEFDSLMERNVNIKDIPFFDSIKLSKMAADFEVFKLRVETPTGDKFLDARVSKVTIGSQLVGFGIVLNDNTALVESINKFKTLSEIDPLTSIYSRGAFFNLSKKLIRNANTFSVFMIDIDDFKLINDNYSHQTGDYILTVFSSIISSLLSHKTSVFGRYGGEEFAIVSTLSSKEDIIKLAVKINFAISNYPFNYNNTTIHVTTSIGVCLSKNNDSNIYKCIAIADRALYKVKSTGKNNFHLSIRKK